jgi:hypothetical protein
LQRSETLAHGEGLVPAMVELEHVGIGFAAN